MSLALPTATQFAEMAPHYPDQVGALELALKAAKVDARSGAPTGHVYRPAATLNGWCVVIAEDAFVEGLKPGQPGVIGYLANIPGNR